MNDASGEHVEKHAREAEDAAALELEGRRNGDHKMCEEMQQNPRPADPTRWWFASSAFPMIAGTLGPVASAFSICALVRPWRQYLPAGTSIDQAIFVNDPEWLLIVNAIQLVVALVANLFLLLNMARRIRFTLAMPVTIVGWYLSAICLLALTATAAGLIVLEPLEDHIWSQAFYYGVFATVLYFIVATLLVVTALGARAGKYDRDFQLTTSQRTLMLQTIMFLMYLLIGALVFSTIEGWAYLDAVYWADVTLFTVGFGDMSASTTLGRALLFPYALIGVISLGLVIGSIRSLVLERGRRLLDARMVEKKRRHIVKRMTLRGEHEILVPIREDGSPVRIEDLPPFSPTPTRTNTSLGVGPRNEFERREKEFKLMRRIQRQAADRRRWIAMGLSSGTWVVLWLVGALVFQNCEAKYQGWTYFDSVYFAFVSLTTIGYGDVTPVSNPGKAFFVFWSLLAVPTMTVLISNAGDTIVKSIRDITNELGSITILPSDRGMSKDVKAILKTLSCGMLFDEDIEDTPPGFLGTARLRTAPDEPGEETEEEAREEREFRSKEDLADEENILGESSRATVSAPSNSAEESAPSHQDQKIKKEKEEEEVPRPTIPRRTTSATEDTLEQLHTASRIATEELLATVPSKPADYHVLLIDEIDRVSQHLHEKPPRRYSYAEWAWYLRLMGEDERSAENHRRARPHMHPRPQGLSRAGTWLRRGADDQRSVDGGNEIASGDVESESDGKDAVERARGGAWSWVGHRSPLMGGSDEAAWIHQGLVRKLAEELRAFRDNQRKIRGKGLDGI